MTALSVLSLLLSRAGEKDPPAGCSCSPDTHRDEGWERVVVEAGHLLDPGPITISSCGTALHSLRQSHRINLQQPALRNSSHHARQSQLLLQFNPDKGQERKDDQWTGVCV